MSWGTQRRLTIILGFIFILAAIFGVYYYFYIRIPTSCSDSVQNQNEIDIDCGGPCEAICKSEILPLAVEWTRPFKTLEGQYDVAALITNRNTFFGIPKFAYKFSLFDEKNVFVAEKEGTIFINPNEKVLVFASGLNTGKRVATRAFIEFDKEVLSQGWVRVGDVSKKPKLDVGSDKLESGALPKLSAEISNDSPYNVSGIDVAAIVYNEENNAIAVSTTFIDAIDANTNQAVNFTWPSPFSSKPSRADILPRINWATK